MDCPSAETVRGEPVRVPRLHARVAEDDLEASVEHVDVILRADTHLDHLPPSPAIEVRRRLRRVRLTVAIGLGGAGGSRSDPCGEQHGGSEVHG